MPQLVKQISIAFNLKELKELHNLTYNYVLSGLQGNTPIILKLGLDNEALKREALTLKCFANVGVVKLLAEDKGMLLLEKAVPGISLKSYFPEKETESIQIACGLIKKLSFASIPNTHNFPHIKDWLSVLDNNWNIPPDYLFKAKKLRSKLLKMAWPDILLHGDLHHDNILQHGSDWLVIDPKGVIGEQVYEIAAFIRNPIPNLLTNDNAADIIQNRIDLFSHILNISKIKIANWCFVQAVLAWI